jgi:hypothetical protein
VLSGREPELTERSAAGSAASLRRCAGTRAVAGPESPLAAPLRVMNSATTCLAGYGRHGTSVRCRGRSGSLSVKEAMH